MCAFSVDASSSSLLYSSYLSLRGASSSSAYDSSADLVLPLHIPPRPRNDMSNKLRALLSRKFVRKKVHVYAPAIVALNIILHACRRVFRSCRCSP